MTVGQGVNASITDIPDWKTWTNAIATGTGKYYGHCKDPAHGMTFKAVKEAKNVDQEGGFRIFNAEEWAKIAAAKSQSERADLCKQLGKPLAA